MFGMENVLNGGEADVLVHAAIAGDIVRVQQFVIVIFCADRRVCHPR